MRRVAASLSGYRGLKADLLVALKKAQPLTAKELGERFGLTANALRRHLKALEEAEVVRYRREVRGVGGPVYAYSLTASGESLFPNAYSDALVAALESLGERAGPEAVVGLFERQWGALAAEAGPALAGLPLGERAQLLAELRSSQGYMAEAVLEPGEEGAVVVREHNCAVRAAADRFPEICAAERAMFERILDATVERRRHILAGCNTCEYVVRAKSERGKTAGALP